MTPGVAPASRSRRSRPGTHRAARAADVAARRRPRSRRAGVEVHDVWDSGVCHGASFRDPAGNVLMLHRALRAARTALQVEQVDFINVPTRDAKRAFAWYHDVLGLPLDPNNPEELRAGR